MKGAPYPVDDGKDSGQKPLGRRHRLAGSHRQQMGQLQPTSFHQEDGQDESATNLRSAQVYPFLFQCWRGLALLQLLMHGLALDAPTQTNGLHHRSGHLASQGGLLLRQMTVDRFGQRRVVGKSMLRDDRFQDSLHHCPFYSRSSGDSRTAGDRMVKQPGQTLFPESLLVSVRSE